MVGSSLLVVPQLKANNYTEVYLPEGYWYSLRENKPYLGGTVRLIEAPLS
jgi:alpha-glucosidase (family GH31 glycosyl hydrolase)